MEVDCLDSIGIVESGIQGRGTRDWVTRLDKWPLPRVKCTQNTVFSEAEACLDGGQTKEASVKRKMRCHQGRNIVDLGQIYPRTYLEEEGPRHCVTKGKFLLVQGMAPA
jgi:hypothetical protein